MGQRKYIKETVRGQLTFSGKEGDSSSLVSGTTSTTNAVNVVLGVVGVVIVQYMGDVANIFEKTCNVSKQSISQASNVAEEVPILSRVRLDASLSLLSGLSSKIRSGRVQGVAKSRS